MLKTKFGKRLFSLLLVLVCVFALASCGGGVNPSEAPIAEATERAEEIHAQLIWDKTAMTQITSDVKGFINKTKYENVTVAWESSEEDVISTTGKVSRPNFDDERAVVVEEATEDKPAVKVVPVTITATITAVAEWEEYGQEYSKEIVLTKEFKFTVETIAEGTQTGTIAAVKAAAAAYIYDEMGVQRELVSNSSIVYNAMVEGVVSVVLLANGSGQFMIHDGTEGIYVYKAVDGLEAGDRVSVVGEIYSYYGSLQFGSNITVSVLEEGAGLDAEYRETTPQELEDEGAARNDKGLVKAGYYGGELVNVYGKLVKEAATGGSSDQYHVADAKTGEKLWIYYKSYDADMEETLKAFDGKYVNLRGVMYDRDSRLQKNEILWDGTIEEAEEPVLTDADKVAIALAAVVVPTQAEADFEVALEEGYVWEVVSGAAIAFEGNVAKVTRGEKDEVVTLKLTVTVGEASDSKEFEVAVPAAKLNIISIAEAIVLGGTEKNVYTEEKYYIQGIVKEVQNETYGNMVIEDATGSILVYGTYSADGATRYDKLEAKPQVGDLVTMYGVLGYYNAPQMKNGWLAEYYDVVTYEEAFTLAGTEKNVYTEAKYTLQGVVKEVQNETYGNIVITDGTNEILVYGTYDVQGNRYDALEYKPQVGDFVTVNGILGYYNAPQMKNGTIVSTINPVSIAGAIANAGTEKDVYTKEMYILKGVVKEIQNEKYGNMVITDGTNEILIYGLYSADGETRFDAMEVKPQVGQEVIVRGIIGYYSAPQMKNGQLLVIQEAEAPVDPEDPETPETPAGLEYTIAGAMPEGLTYITNNESYPDPSFYSNGGLKMNFENMGALTAAFEAQTSVSVVLNVLALNSNTKTSSSTNFFTVYGLNAAGEVVAQAALTSVVAGENTVALTGEGIVQVKVILTGYPVVDGTAHNVSLGGVKVVLGEAGDTPVDPEDPETPAEPQEVTCAEAAALEDGVQVILKGTIHEVNGAWNAEYSNMNVTLKDATGTFYLFRLSTKVELGDFVTVTGTIGSYYGDKQLAQGGTAVITGHDDSYDVEEELPEGTHSYSYTGSTTNMDGTNQAALLGFDATIFTVVGTKCTNNNFPGLNKDGSLRLYHDSANQDGNEVSVTATSKIVSITITCASSYDAGLQVLVNGEAVEAVDGVYTINATSFVLKNVGSKQIRITTLNITLE